MYSELRFGVEAHEGEVDCMAPGEKVLPTPKKEI